MHILLNFRTEILIRLIAPLKKDNSIDFIMIWPIIVIIFRKHQINKFAICVAKIIPDT
jgi:hypothetical protein